MADRSPLNLFETQFFVKYASIGSVTRSTMLVFQSSVIRLIVFVFSQQGLFVFALLSLCFRAQSSDNGALTRLHTAALLRAVNRRVE